MLGQTLVTHQTGPEGKVVGKLLIAEPATIARELYFAILLDRASSAPVVIASTEGGMDIEHVAKHTPEKIFREPIHPVLGLQPFQSRRIDKALGLSGAQIGAAAKLFGAMFRLFVVRPEVVGGEVAALGPQLLGLAWKVSLACASVAMGRSSLVHFTVQPLMKELVCQPGGGLAMKVCAKARGVVWPAAAMALVTVTESQ